MHPVHHGAAYLDMQRINFNSWFLFHFHFLLLLSNTPKAHLSLAAGFCGRYLFCLAETQKQPIYPPQGWVLILTFRGGPRKSSFLTSPLEIFEIEIFRHFAQKWQNGQTAKKVKSGQTWSKRPTVLKVAKGGKTGVQRCPKSS